ncbi:MAG: methionine aminotransferase [Calditrichaceae bacterium]
MKFKSKQPDLGVTIFATMSRMANEYKAINLSQGFPDFSCHPDLIRLVNKYMRAGQNQYAPMQGVLRLRERLAEKIEQTYGAVYNPVSEITITAGATEALFAAISAVVHPGDEVIVFEPWYDAYVPVIQYNLGIPVYVKLKQPDYRIHWPDVQKAITANTRLIIFNSPHNPSGSILTKKDINQLIKLVNNTDIILINDEVYEHIIFDGEKHHSFSRYPELRERSMVISSFGKTYHTTGWKIGYCAAPNELSVEFRKVHQFLTYAVNTPIQMAYADFLDHKNLYLQLAEFYQQKRDLFAELIKDSRFKLLPCRGTYFQLADYSAVSDENDFDFCKWLTTEFKVAAIPTSVFYHEQDDHKIVRFCFAKQDETLQKAAERLCRI